MSLQVVSYGGGVQSTALLVLAARGEIPHRTLLFCNVGDDSENPDTLAYVRDFARPFAEAHGVEFHELQKRLRGGQKDTVVEREKRTERTIGIPMYMGNGAPGNRSCTYTFKIGVVAKWTKEHGASVDDPAHVALGISIDEYQRMKTSTIKHQVSDYPLIDRRWSRDDCRKIIADAGLPVPPKSSCYFCLAPETEVITRDGIRAIGELAGQDVELLVPSVGKLGGLSEQSSFRTVPVRSFGTQRLWKIVLAKGRATKEIHATAEHRWILRSGKQWQDASTYWRTTETLRPGDMLKGARAKAMVKEAIYPFPVAQGFVFGDGARGQGDRPATLQFHGAKKAMLRFFAGYEPTEYPTPTGKTQLYIHGLPRTWKDLPDIRESRSFLLSWLAGYFAADGSVSKAGQVTMDSAYREHLQFVRSALSIIGVRTTDIRSKMRKGTREHETPLYTLGFNPRDVGIEFFLLDHHRERVAPVIATEDSPRTHWTVVSVEPTDRVEEVFCATVDGIEAFALTDNLMTGNCPFQRPHQWQRLRKNHPDRFAKAVELERIENEKRRALGKDEMWMSSLLKPLDEAIVDTGQLELFDEDDDGTCDIGGYCFS